MKTYATKIATALALAVFLWPLPTPISGRIRFRLLKEKDVPLVGAQVRESYSYGSEGHGSGERISDATGSVEFPAQNVTEIFGVRLLRMAHVFEPQPRRFVTIQFGLPAGHWLPASWLPGTALGEGDRDILHPTYNDGPNRAVYVMNSDRLRPPYAYICGDAPGFVSGTEIVLRFRSPTPKEEDSIWDRL